MRDKEDGRRFGLEMTKGTVETRNRAMLDSVRVDKWLWAMRLFKTRALATAACRKSAVCVNGAVAKPSGKIRPGDRVEAKTGALTRTYRVVALTDKRIGAARLPEFIEDETPEKEFVRAREQRENSRRITYTGGGRPTKKNRRDLEKFFGRGSN